MDWRISPTLCIRFLPGLWFPDIFHRKEKEYFAIMFPGMGIAFDYKSVSD